MVRQLGRFRYPAQAAKVLQELSAGLDRNDPVHLGGAEWFHRIVPRDGGYVLEAVTRDELKANL